MAGGKQTKARKPEVFGKGNVTPTQIAFIVDRYLCDNNFSSTRSTFRNEASSFIANSPIHEAPKTLLTLGEMLDEYICLKEQKVILDQERVLVEQEKNRVQMLLQGMQNVMTAYNASGNLPASAPAAKSAVVAVPQPTFIYKSQAGNSTSVQNKSNTRSLPQSSNSNAEGGNFSTPTLNVSDRKRKDTEAVDAPSAAKKPRGRSSSRKIVQGQNAVQQYNNTVNTMVAKPCSIQSSTENCIPNESQIQGSNVAKCLFNQSTTSAPSTSNSPVPKTPPRTKSSQSDTHISTVEISSVATCNRAVTPSHCTIISTKRVMVSPAKQIAYIEMSRCISPVKTNSNKVSKRDHVRSRLNFDAVDVPENLDNPLPNEISTSESEKELDIFDMDFPNLDALGMDFSFTEMLNDLDFSGEGIDFSCHPTSSPSMDNASGSSHEYNCDHATSESTVAEVLSEKDMKMLGPDCLTAMKSVTKSIIVISPEKKCRLSVDQESCT